MTHSDRGWRSDRAVLLRHPRPLRRVYLPGWLAGSEARLKTRGASRPMARESQFWLTESRTDEWSRCPAEMGGELDQISDLRRHQVPNVSYGSDRLA